MQTHHSIYCRDLVQAQDPDRFLLSMVMLPAARPALWALFAFNHEIAKTRELVTETQLGLIRLQWWREALQGIYERDTVLEHDVVQALAATIKAYDLPQQWFEDLLYAREFDLEDVLPSDLQGMVNYADYTTSPLNRLVLRVLGEDEKHTDELIRDISAAYAMTGLLRAAPYHCGQARCYLPENMMQAHNVRMEDFYAYKGFEALCPVTREISAYIGNELLCGEKTSKGFLKASRVMTGIYLKQIKSYDYNVFDPKMARLPYVYHLRFILGFLF